MMRSGVLAVLAVSLWSSVAFAKPTNEVWIEYYSDATKTVIVGKYHLGCQGNHTMQGVQSDHYLYDSGACYQGGTIDYGNRTCVDAFNTTSCPGTNPWPSVCNTPAPYPECNSEPPVPYYCGPPGWCY